MSAMECTPQRVQSEIGHLINNQDTCHHPPTTPNCNKQINDIWETVES